MTQISRCFAITVETAWRVGLVSHRGTCPWNFAVDVPGTFPSESDRS